MDLVHMNTTNVDTANAKQPQPSMLKRERLPEGDRPVGEHGEEDRHSRLPRGLLGVSQGALRRRST